MIKPLNASDETHNMTKLQPKGHRTLTIFVFTILSAYLGLTIAIAADPSPAPTVCGDYYPGYVSPTQVTELDANFVGSNLNATVKPGYFAAGLATWLRSRWTSFSVNSTLLVGPDNSLTADLSQFAPIFSKGQIQVWVGSEIIYTGVELPSTKKLDPKTQYFRVFDTDVITSSDPSVSKWRMLVHRRTVSGVLRNELEIQLGSQGASQPIVVPIKNWSPGEWHQLTLGWNSTDVANPLVEIYLDGRLAARSSFVLFTPAVIAAINAQHTKLYWINSRRVGDAWSSNLQLKTDSLKLISGDYNSISVARQFSAAVADNSFQMRNQALEIALTGPMYGYGLAAIHDANNCDPKTSQVPGRALWAVQLRHATQANTTVTIRNQSGDWGDLNYTKNPTTGSKTLNWPRIALPNATFSAYSRFSNLGGILTVAVDLIPIPGSVSEFEVRLTKARVISDVWKLERIEFLGLEGLGPIARNAIGTEWLVPDHSIGRSIPNPFGVQDLGLQIYQVPGFTKKTTAAETGTPVEKIVDIYSMKRPTLPWSGTFPSRGMSMQVMGLYSGLAGSTGLMIADPDPAFRVKNYTVVSALPNGLSPETVDPAINYSSSYLVTPSERASGEFNQVYGTVLGIQSGGWYSLARAYRALVLQRFTALKKFADREDFPKSLLSVGLRQMASSFATETSYLNTDCLSLRNQYLSPDDGDLLMCEARSWHTDSKYGQNAGNPFAEPKPGITAFVENLAATSSMASFYNDISSCSQPSAATWISSCAPYKLWTTPAIQSSTACPNSAGWSQKLTSYFANFASTVKPQAIYLDVIGANSTHICAADNTSEHPHAANDPTLYVSGVTKEVKALRQAVNSGNPDSRAALFTESFNEAYVGSIDGFLNADTDFENIVPFAQAVYHDHAVFDGLSVFKTESCAQEDVTANFSGTTTDEQKKKYLTTQLAKLAWYFNWGGLPISYDTVIAPNKPLASPLINYARWRKYLNEYLVLGDMLEPVILEFIGQPIEGRMPIDHFQGNTGLSTAPSFFTSDQSMRAYCYWGDFKVPRVLTSSWRSPDGVSVGAVIVSNSDNATVIHGKFGENAAWNLANLASKRWSLIRLNDQHQFQAESDEALPVGALDLTVKLAPREVVFIKMY